MCKIIDNMQENIAIMQGYTKEIAKLNEEMRKGRKEIGVLLDVCMDQLDKMRGIMHEMNI